MMVIIGDDNVIIIIMTVGDAEDARVVIIIIMIVGDAENAR